MGQRLGVRAWPREQGQAQIEHLHLAAAGEQQVGRLHVAVDHALGVGVLQTPCGLRDPSTGLRHRQRSLLLDELRQVRALDEFHRQVVSAVDLVRVENRHDVGVRQLRGRSGLARNR